VRVAKGSDRDLWAAHTLNHRRRPRKEDDTSAVDIGLFAVDGVAPTAMPTSNG
jgi:hypothetical protein